jgi:hypothetical protein
MRRTDNWLLLLDRAPLLLFALGVFTWAAGSIGWSRLITARLSQTKTPTAAVSPPVPDPRAAELLRNVADKLDALQDLEVSVASDHLAGTPENGLREKTNSDAAFDREKQTWHITGKTAPIHPDDPSSGAPYDLRSSPGRTTLAISIVNGGRPVEYGSFSEAVDTLMGVSRGNANIMPDMVATRPFLIPKWNRSQLRFWMYVAENAAMLPDETVDSHPCYCITSRHDVGTWTVWIDQESLLPRKVKVTQDAKQRRKREPPFGGSFGYIEAEHRLAISVAQ